MRWVEGVELGTGITVLVPYDAVVLGTDPVDFPGIAQSTNGIGAGTSVPARCCMPCARRLSATRCACGASSPIRRRAPRGWRLPAFDDPEVDALDFRIAEAGFQLRLYDQTSNSGLPVIYAVLSPGDGADKHFDAATGASCHPVPGIAARRAIVEAAQTRITNIAGARDDIIEDEYDEALGRSIAVLTEDAPATRHAPEGSPRGASTDELIMHMRAGLARAGLERIVVVPMGGSRFGIDVVRVFVPGLEDRLTNRNWRPGKRAATAMLGFL